MNFILYTYIDTLELTVGCASLLIHLYIYEVYVRWHIKFCRNKPIIRKTEKWIHTIKPKTHYCEKYISYTQTHTHTHNVYIYIYIYIYWSVFVIESVYSLIQELKSYIMLCRSPDDLPKIPGWNVQCLLVHCGDVAPRPPPPVSVASCEKQRVSDVSKLVDKTVGLHFGLVERTHN